MKGRPRPHLQQPVAELAVVADSFHTKPLRQWLQSAARYQVLRALERAPSYPQALELLLDLRSAQPTVLSQRNPN